MSVTDTNWYKAYTLSERHKTLQTLSPLSPDQQKQAEQRMKRWRSQAPFAEEQFFSQRLELLNATEETFSYLLTENADSLADRFPGPPDWLADIKEAFQGPLTLDQEIIALLQTTSLVRVLEPLIALHIQRLRTRFQALKQQFACVPVDFQQLEMALIENLLPQLEQVITKTMVLELNIARLQGVLQGQTPQERFQSFLSYVCTPEHTLHLLQEYPVLARILIISLNNWLTVNDELLQRLCADWKEICQQFFPQKEPGQLIKIEADAGDRHRGGHSVTFLSFSSGLRLVYKPKSLAVDVNFQALLGWLNEHGQQPALSTTRILARETYGWTEFLPFQSCVSQAEVERFYQRQGAYLALLHILVATDFHNENIIAVGEHPFLVDYEALFQPSFPAMTQLLTTKGGYAAQALDRSVFRVGMLPFRLWGNGKFAGVDLSGLSNASGQLSPYKGAQWVDAETDRMHLIRQYGFVAQGCKNVPQLQGVYVNALDYQEAFLSGFTHTYELLQRFRVELQSPHGPLACFEQNETRIILRPTFLYSLMLRDSYHPDVLRDALNRDRFFDKLWASSEVLPYPPELIACEQADLWRRDVPIFFTRPGSEAIWSSTGERFDNMLDISGMDLMHERLQQLGSKDLQWQRWIIQAAFTALSINNGNTRKVKYPLVDAPEAQPSVPLKESLLEAAKAIGDHLIQTSICNEDTASWVGLTAFQEKYWGLSTLGLDFYAGLPGIALFFAYLGHITGRKVYTHQARLTLESIRQLLLHNQASARTIGAFGEWGGIIYLWTHLAALWHQPELYKEAEQFIMQLPEHISKDVHFDVVDGTAGCLLSMLALYQCYPSNSIKAAMLNCGDHLLAQAQEMPTGLAWVTPQSQRPLAGFSHGAAGIALALVRLYACTNEKRFYTAAVEAIAYERTLFSEQLQNWRDIREEEDSAMTAWCHGAPGIGLARLAALSMMDSPAIREEIEQAVQTTQTTGFGQNHSLCHGDFGNIELLLLASQTLHNPSFQQQVHNLARRLLTSIEKHGWVCGTPLGIETPGFMTGLAGIGYELLRLAGPETLPSLLVLEAPLTLEVPVYSV